MKAPAQTNSVEAIARRLRLIRLAYGVVQRREKPISQAEFAGLCEISSQAWNNAETGDNRLGVDAAMKVSLRTGVSMDYIYFGKTDHLPHAWAIAIEQLEREKPVKRA